MHVRDRENQEKFNWRKAELKYLPLSGCQIKRTEWLTPAANEIGLGAVLFLFTMKALFYLFLIFTIISIPLIVIFVNGSGPSDEYKGGQFTNIFGKLSLGNIGNSDHACSSINFANYEKEFDLKCPYGQMTELTAFGLQRIDNQTC
jgi:hypothetical protein